MELAVNFKETFETLESIFSVILCVSGSQN